MCGDTCRRETETAQRAKKYRKLPSAGSYPVFSFSAFVFQHRRLADGEADGIIFFFSRKMFIGGLSWQTSPGEYYLTLINPLRSIN